MMELTAGKLWGLRRLADEQGRFKMTAVDQRPPIKNLVAERRGSADAPYEDVCAVKELLVRELAAESSAMLLDPHYAYPAALRRVRPAQGLLLTLEDSVFEETPQGRRSAEIERWSVDKIKRAGGDAVKVLAWYRPDADRAVLAHQHEFVARAGAACALFDIPFVLELLVYPLPGDDSHTRNSVEEASRRADHVLGSVAEFADPRYGVDLFKLESPVMPSVVSDPDEDRVGPVQELFNELGRRAGRPWVMLSAGAGPGDFQRVLTLACRAGASGYLAGRAIWWSAFQSFPDLDAMTDALRSTSVPYMRELNRLTDRLARPWFKHTCYGDGPSLAGAGPGFRRSYRDFGGTR
jgi:tagatose 1,6-diphosphate aldolase